jgi:alkylation response protein AidB-like acyl-CoA dehydrogenase
MFHLSDDERVELRDTARRLLSERSSSLLVRGLLDDPDGYDHGLWASMAELGWSAINVAEEHGGLGASFTDLAVILHELGRQVTPSPMLASVVLGAGALSASSNAELAASILPAVAGGNAVLTAALSNPAGSYEPSRSSVGWSTRSGTVVLDGAARFVPDAGVADHVVVTAADDSGAVTLALVDRADVGVSVDVEPTFDRTRRLGRVTFDSVAVPEARLLTEPGRGAELHHHVVALGAIAAMCDAVGAAEHVLEIANQYAKERFQFNRPIGSFQAVKHHLANMFTDVEASRAAVVQAVDAIDAIEGGGGDIRHAAAVAKSFAGPACARVAALAVQVHGGIGFTWEHDAHLFLKRTKLDDALFGTAKWHRQHLAALLIDEQMAI